MEHGISWQEVAAFMAILATVVGFYTATHVRLNGHDIKIGALEKKEEKTDLRFDNIMAKLESILIKNENKQDRHE
jgi:hypothetical protein